MKDSKLKPLLSISTEKDKLDLDLIHSFLKASYWAKDISKESVLTSIQNSLCFGLYQNSQQIGFTRVISDYATFAYLCDVFITEPNRKRGQAEYLVKTAQNDPSLKNIPIWLLATRDAHGLYEKLGFMPLTHPSSYMQIYKK